jgi:hypothetical protein
MILARFYSKVRRTAAISCEAHIDDAKAVVEHLQLRRFASFIALFDSQA